MGRHYGDYGGWKNVFVVNEMRGEGEEGRRNRGEFWADESDEVGRDVEEGCGELDLREVSKVGRV